MHPRPIINYECDRCGFSDKSEVCILPPKWEQWGGDYLCPACTTLLRRRLSKFKQKETAK